MNYSIVDTHTGETVESFDAAGHRNTLMSTDLDAMKACQAWGYHKVEGYALETEDGRVLDVVDPYRDEVYKKEIEKDYISLKNS